MHETFPLFRVNLCSALSPYIQFLKASSTFRSKSPNLISDWNFIIFFNIHYFYKLLQIRLANTRSRSDVKIITHGIHATLSIDNPKYRCCSLFKSFTLNWQVIYFFNYPALRPAMFSYHDFPDLACLRCC